MFKVRLKEKMLFEVRKIQNTFCDAKNEVHSRLRSLRFSPNVKLAKMIININININC